MEGHGHIKCHVFKEKWNDWKAVNISYVSRKGGGGKVKLMALYVIYKSKTYLEPTVIVFCRYRSLGGGGLVTLHVYPFNHYRSNKYKFDFM